MDGWGPVPWIGELLGGLVLTMVILGGTWTSRYLR
jgi:hypothetical protein